MLTKFWESLGEGLSERWLSLLGPSLIFWAGGLFFSIGWKGIESLSGSILGLTVIQQVALLIGLLILVLGSASFLQQMSYPILRILEGYWSFPFLRLRILLIKWQNFLITRWESRWQILEQKYSKKSLSLLEANEHADLERKLHYIPSDPTDYMPTSVGNILKMAETQSRHKYGLDSVVCWPRLWPLLSDNLREELRQSRQSLNQGVELWAWGMLFIVWGFQSWWSILIGLLWAWLAYRMILNAAVVYSDLIETAFDTQRWNLYQALHFKLPNNSTDEIVLGILITQYLWRGATIKSIKFNHPKS